MFNVNMLDLKFKVAQLSIWFSNLESDYRIYFVNRFSLPNKEKAKKLDVTFLFQTKMLKGAILQ